VNTIFQDLRYAARSLRKTPTFTAVAVVTLALGIGVNTAIFSVVNAVLLRPLPFHDPDRLVQLRQPSPGGDRSGESQSYLDVADWRAMNRSFSAIGTYRGENTTLTGDGEPLHLRAAVVSHEVFPLLGVAPALGHALPAESDRPGSRWAVISDGLWRRRFGADRTIVGRPIVVDSRSFVVAGVMPPGFQFPISVTPPEVWINAGIDAERSPEFPDDKSQAEQRGWRSLRTIARLKPGVSLERAGGEMRVIAATLAARYPEDAHMSIDLQLLHRALVRDLRPALLVLFGAVGCVLLIACANIANLLLAKAASREKEFAIRAAIGANRSRMIRQLLTESVLLAALGGGAGLLLARWCIDVVVARGPKDLPRLAEVGLDPWVLLFTAALTLATGFVFGIVPALRSTPSRLANSLKEAGRGSTAGGPQNRFRSFLVVAEVTISLILLAGAGLLLQSFLRLERVDPGFDPGRVLSLRVSLPEARYAKPDQIARFFDETISRAGATPGIVSLAGVGPLPLGGGEMSTTFEIEGKPVARADQPETDAQVATRAYFGTMRIPVLSGRDFSSADALTSTPVAIVNATFAHRFFAGVSPLGRRIKPGISATAGEPPWREIVGVVGDVKQLTLSETQAPQVYLPQSQCPFSSLTLVARTSGNPRDVGRAIEAAVHAVDPSVPVFEIRPIDEYLSQVVARPRFNTVLLALFAGLALLLTAIGFYGVLSYSVAQRTHEIGIRRALGADSPAVYRLIVGQGMRLAALGLALGVLGALAATRLLSTLLFGIGATDGPTFAAVTVALAGVALLASWLPARRAAAIEPTVALRQE